MRYAVITGARSSLELASYLPGNYTVIAEFPAEHGFIAAAVAGDDLDNGTLEDSARWLGHADLACLELASRARALEHLGHVAAVAQANDPHTNYGAW